MVPAFQDVEHSRRELAETGAIFGAQVVRFSHLSRLIARRAGYHARVASEIQQQLVAEDAVRRAGFTVLAESAERPGFARAALRFIAELERSMVEPPRLIQALRAWAGDGPAARVRRGDRRAVPPLPRRPGRRRAGGRRPVRLGSAGGAARATRPGAARRCSSTGSTTSPSWSSARSRSWRSTRARRDRVAAVRAGSRGVQGHGHAVRAAAARSPPRGNS